MTRIRAEEPGDAEAVAGLHVRAWRAGYAGIMPAEVLAGLDVAAWARRRRELGSGEGGTSPFSTLLAERAGAVVGFTTVGPYRNDQRRDDLDPRYGEILTMYVDPAHWGGGVGRELMSAARVALAERGWTELRLWVLADNARARRFYERGGLVADGERSTFELQRSGGRPAVGLVEVRYAGRLDPV